MVDIAVALGADETAAQQDMANVMDFEIAMANVRHLIPYMPNKLEKVYKKALEIQQWQCTDGFCTTL